MPEITSRSKVPGKYEGNNKVLKFNLKFLKANHYFNYN